MTTDFRALCAELLAALEIQLDELRFNNRLCLRARAALAEPVPPADREVADPVIPCEYAGYLAAAYRNGFHAGYKHALTRLALAEPVAPANGEVAELVEWLRCHASSKLRIQREQFLRAADLLERLAPQPVPVSERSPEVTDCDAFGRCWCYGEGGDMFGWTCAEPSEFYYYSATHWLPFTALLLPTVGQAPNA